MPTIARLVVPLRVVMTFAIVTASFVLFRAKDTGQAAALYESMGRFDWQAGTLPLTLPAWLIAALIVWDLIERDGRSIARWPVPLRWAAYHCGFIAVVGVVVARYIQGAPSVRYYIYYGF